jgi:hypothetical protein
VTNSISKFSKYIKEHPLTAEDIIEFFSDKENKDACESFVRRHPETPYKKYIPK